MSKKVYCIAQFLPKPGKEAELFKVLQGLEANTLREAVSYTHLTLPTTPYV